MKKKKDKLFFVKEMPASEEQNVAELTRISNSNFERLLKESKKPRRKRAA